jgi:two-component system NtrC family response regulator
MAASRRREARVAERRAPGLGEIFASRKMAAIVLLGFASGLPFYLTNKDLQAMMKAGTFREDLYYRINGVTVRIPPLRERSGDAVVIAQASLERRAREHTRAIKGFTPEALKGIEGYPWPGNIRELENRVNGAVIMTDGKYVSVEELGLPGDGGSDMSWLNLRAARQLAESEAIRQALALSGNNISRTAELLGITRPTLYDLMDKNQIIVPERTPD